jgi:hypothetical protein
MLGRRCQSAWIGLPWPSRFYITATVSSFQYVSGWSAILQVLYYALSQGVTNNSTAISFRAQRWARSALAGTRM